MKRKILILCATMLMMLGMSIGASAKTYGYLTYEENSDNTITITDCNESAKEIVIPSTLNDMPVTSIGIEAFKDCDNLTRITISDSVTEIGNYAFAGCWILKSVTIADSVTYIGDFAFTGCINLTKITIPSSVTYIGEGAFENPVFTVDENNEHYSSLGGTLFNKDKTTLIQYASATSNTIYIIPDTVTSIGEYAFAEDWLLESVTIPNSVTSIGEYAFKNCTALTSITIPDSVTYIGDFALAGCCLLESAAIPDSITSIADSTFSHCFNLKSITIPDSVTYIGNSAFENCSDLTRVYYGGTKEEWDAISIGSGNDDLTSAKILYNSAITAQVSDAVTKYISDDNKATGFIAIIANGTSITETVESVVWVITPSGGTGVECPVDLPTIITLDSEASAIIGVVLDGLYDKNAIAELKI